MSDDKAVVIRLPTPPGVLMKGPRRPKKAAENDDDLWLVSYSDMLMLLFCFSTMLLSVSTLNVSKLDGLKSEMSHQFGKKNASPQGLQALEKQIRDVAARAGLSQEVRVRSSDQGLVVDLNARILFMPGSAELNVDARTLLSQLAAPLTHQAIEVQVEGHTDPVPIQNARFASNWELSSARATGVVRFLIDSVGYAPNRLRAVGLAATQPVDESGMPLAIAPAASSWTEPYLARQRRVSLVLKPVAEDVAAGGAIGPAGVEKDGTAGPGGGEKEGAAGKGHAATEGAARPGDRHSGVKKG